MDKDGEDMKIAVKELDDEELDSVNGGMSTNGLVYHPSDGSRAVSGAYHGNPVSANDLVHRRRTSVRLKPLSGPKGKRKDL